MIRAAIAGSQTDGWDATNGIPHVNWYRDSSGKIVNQNTGSDLGTGLRAWEILLSYQHAIGGPGKDAEIDAWVARSKPLIIPKAVTKPYDKSWAGFTYLGLLALTGDPIYSTALQQHLKFQMARITPGVGVYVKPSQQTSTAAGAATVTNAFRVDAEVQYGAAMVVGGHMFGDAAMTAAGLRAIQVCFDMALVPKTGMLARMVQVNNGVGKIIDYQHKAGEQGQNVWALAIAAEATGDATIKAHATSLLAALKSSGLHDSTNGGFYFVEFGDTGVVTKDYKELARTMTIARAAYLLGDLALRDEMINCAAKGYIAAPEAGWPYRTTPTFGQFGSENWVTSEAIGIIGDAFFNSGLGVA